MNPKRKSRATLASQVRLTILALCACAAASVCHGEGASNSIEVGVTHENLDHGFTDWQSVYLATSHKLAPRRLLYGEVNEAERFSQRDKKLVAGYHNPLGDKTTALIEAAVSPDHHFMPEWAALRQFERQLGAGWGLQLGCAQSGALLE